ncbi:hypothetical protein GCM10010387_52880 [Streptomyces inusitatus]|uniref:Gram-positive cocci surface proteins LPxTG domain-containing protein n=1 Tax=Streptomyces inusitatus TaxID=68221 RepID=A0A918QIE5_9ACTN|nr:hypothetical protein [Streptomyces inusitatus]GGZ52032.1 hypothetical protein GCM10010387_52880 [Streptomyces inusitatus]
MKTYRLSPRALVVAVAAAGAMIVPAGAAFADSTPTATPSAGAGDTREKKAAAAAEERWANASAADKEALRKKGATAGTVWAPEVRTPRGGVAAGEQPKVNLGDAKPVKPTDRRAPAVTPRGGVAAGEQPRVSPGDAKSTARPSAKPADRRAPAVVAPRGGVAAGERPAESGGTTGLFTGSAVAFALVAGAGVLVVRRRASDTP